ncbi:hypothetical protein ACVPW9_25980, partial [Klebsiella pneumoniae]
DGNGSHASTLKSPSYTKSVSWQHYRETGCTGNANGMTSIALGAHLHFEVRVKEIPGPGIANRLDPAPFIDGFNYP